MLRIVCSTASALALLAPVSVVAQSPAFNDRPTVHVPVKRPTPRELDRIEAQKLFGLGAVHERNNRLVEAMRIYEESLRLDPDAAAIHRALVPLYIALDRGDDVLTSCKRILELDSDDTETGLLYARQLRARERNKEAVEVLSRTAAVPGLKEQPDLHAQVAFELATLREAAGEWDRAEAAFAEAAAILDHPTALLDIKPYSKEEIDAQAAETYERLGRVRLKAGKTDLAVEAFRHAQEKDPARAARLAYNLAEVFRGLGKHREALACLNDYLRTQPQGTEGYELKIALLRKLNRGAEVVAELETAAGRDSHNTALKLLLAREYRRARQARDAELIYRKLLQEAPSPEVFRELFGLYKEGPRRGGDDALALLDDAVKRAVDRDGKPGDAGAAANARSMLQVLRDDAELVRRLLEAAHRRLLGGQGLEYQTRVLLAGLAARTQQLGAAEELYRSCLERGAALRAIEQEVYGGLLRVLVQAHKYEAVVTVCEEGLKKAEATNRVLFFVDLAHAQMSLGHTKEALAAADDAVKHAPDRDRLFCRRVRVDVLTQSERFDDAVAECQALLKEYNQAGEVRDIRVTLSTVYSAARQHSKAEEQLQLILRDDPNDAGANNDLGYLWADRDKNLDEAERMIRKAIELDRQARSSGAAIGLDADRDNAAYVDSLGWVLFRKGELAGARRELEKAAALAGGTDDPVVWDHLGDVRFRQGDKDQAGALWKKAVGLYDTGARRKTDERYKEIQEKLRRLMP
jgi:tetratricopeptide (TPR) repeat protein